MTAHMKILHAVVGKERSGKTTWAEEKGLIEVCFESDLNVENVVNGVRKLLNQGHTLSDIGLSFREEDLKGGAVAEVRGHVNALLSKLLGSTEAPDWHSAVMWLRPEVFTTSLAYAPPHNSG